MIRDVATQRLNIISKQTARGLKQQDLPSEYPFPKLSEEQALISKNVVEALKQRAGLEPLRKDEGGHKLTKENLFQHDGTLPEEGKRSAPLVRGAASETEAGSKATSAAGNSLGMAGRGADRERRNGLLNWGQYFDKALSFMRDCLYGRFKPGDPSAKCNPN